MNRIRRFFTTLDDLEAGEFENDWWRIVYVAVGGLMLTSFFGVVFAGWLTVNALMGG